MDEGERTGLVEIGGNGILFDCPMHQHTTLRVGGKGESLYFARELQELQRMLSFLSRGNIPYLVVGKGSNILVKDEGFKGVGIFLQGHLAAIERNGDTTDQLIKAGGGLSIGELLTHCSQQGLGGLEFLTGIPGTVGGAVAMNAGAFGKDTGSMVQQIQFVTHQGKLATRNSSKLNFSYRGLSVPEGAVIVNVWFNLNYERPEILSKRKEDYLARRKASQPLEYPSGGSVFKNPHNDYAARLIERTGLKGRVIGGAMISTKHANFIVNMGGAIAEDILALMELAREKVKEETGIELETELRVVGI
ncbi:MAG: UDP-N-acetylmuramate dehydrogenase [Desulfatiglandales bacterium]|nr:UDP-N-acetylmuramate dehydrogenase [Desulfatiglandales bacterium]